MRRFIFGSAVPVLLGACLFSGDGTTSRNPSAGTYRGDHGAMTRINGLESELILHESGTYRYFLIDSNTAYFTSKGRWSATGSDMIWTGVARAFLYQGGFRRWDTLAIPDTSYLRNVTDTGFERLEVTRDTQFVSVVRWVEYRRITPENLLVGGSYAFRETYPDGVDPTRIVNGLTRLEITPNGPYSQQIFRDDTLYRSDVDSLWTQVGTHLITTRNRHCEFQAGDSSCSDAPPEYEYVARLSRVGASGFHLWMAQSFTFQPNAFWAAFQRILP